MAVIKLPVEITNLNAASPDATAVIGGDASVLHWWTTIKPAFAGELGNGLLAGRKGGVGMLPASVLGFSPRFGYDFVSFNGSTSGGQTSEYMRADIPPISGPFSIVTMTRWPFSGNQEPLGLFFAPSAQVVDATTPSIGLRPRPSGQVRQVTLRSGVADGTFTIGASQPPTGGVNMLTTVIDTDPWTVKQSMDGGAVTTADLGAFDMSVAAISNSAWTLRLGCWLRSEPFAGGGSIMEALVIKGDVTEDRIMMDRLLAYHADNYVNVPV